jgi:hypothetical protein
MAPLCKVHAQAEYFVEFNPYDGTFKKLKKFHNVNWVYPGHTTYDETHHRYFFCGGPDTKQWYLFTVDALTGDVLDSCDFLNFSNTQDNVLNLQYDHSNDTIYGIHWNDSLKMEYFVTIDPHSGSFSIIKEIPRVRYVGLQSIIDISRKEYIFFARDTSDNNFLCVIDIRTGDTVKTLPMSVPIFKLTYDSEADKLYCVYGPPHVTQQVGIINRTSGAMDGSFPIDGMFSHYITDNYCFNRNDKELILVGADSSNLPQMFVMDMSNGNVRSRIHFPFVRNDGKNLVCFIYDNMLSRSFAVHWDPDAAPATVGKMAIYPNPSIEAVNIEFPNTYPEITVFLYDAGHKYIGKQVFSNTSKAVVNHAQFASGIYFAEIYVGNVYFTTAKLNFL